MVDGFVDKWKKKPQQSSFLSKIKDVGKPSVGLKKQISTVLQRIEIQKQKLNNAQTRFEKRDATLFKRTVKALSERDTMRANVLAGELAEIRKVEKMLMHASLALESVSLRLNTVSELGDIVTVIAPAAGVLNNIRNGMSGVFPEAGQELENIGTLLTDIVSTTHQDTGVPVNIGTASLEAEKILSEAETAAEQKLRQQLPEISTVPPPQEKTGVET
ncbi:MAG: Snf7 family protein [Candidatus Bathyarchaeia archaeon]|nr:Snf7 family protein [Candidatus Bathyarchaeia archaeon]